MNESNIIPFVVYGAVGFTLLLLFIVYLLVRYKQRQYSYESEKKEREYQYNNELLHSRLELQEHLLNQVSREIHDNVGQVLSLVKVHLFSVSNQLENARAIQLLNTSSILLDKAIDDLRNISHAQSGNIVQRLGLQETIGKELGYISTLNKLACTMHVEGTSVALSSEHELLLYRIVQEAIHNCIKHANATQLAVTLNYDPKALTLSVIDNGTGFDVADERTTQSIGLSHMRQRAMLLDAAITIQSVLSHGTTIILKMPIN